jgi:hypothetical protein
MVINKRKKKKLKYVFVLLIIHMILAYLFSWKTSDKKYQDEEIKIFGGLLHPDDSKKYIENNLQLISQKPIDYL